MIGVAGATGVLGGRVAARLAERGVQQRLIVRDPSRAPALPGAEVVQGASYGQEGFGDALDGVDTLYLVSAAEAPDRVRLHLAAVDAAAAAGVGRIVYTSFVSAAPDATFTFARDHFHTEEHIRASGLEHTFVRSSLYLDYIPFLAGPDGVIRGPAGDGRVAAVARDDIADVGAAVLAAGGEHDGRTYDVTGRQAFTGAQAAAELERVTGRPVTFVDETLEEARASRAPTGAPAYEIEGWVTSYAAIATGEMDVVTDTVARVAGHEPQTLAEFLERNAASYAHLLG